MERLIRVAFGSALIVLLGVGASAQSVPGLLSSPAMDGAGTVFLDRAFVGTITTMVKRGGKDVPVETQFMTADGKVRTELQSKPPAPADPKLKPAPRIPGMDLYVQIARPDQKAAYLILPNLKGYCVLREPPPAPAPANPAVRQVPVPPLIQRVELGNEVIDTHPCAKVQVTVTMPDGKKTEGTVWEATDLGRLPLKLEMKADGTPVSLQFTNVRPERPAPALFELPQGLTKYDSLQDMMMVGFQQMMQKNPGKPGPEPTSP